ncbi:hypothetical protein CP556_24855 [Natrinema sp. CBA1119]|uniref:hypothetical protein n=1 Tax=Natrinema sp. CBA1119 TaxID=1608465 RepID=UPI000BF27211|nr:hypothetical protein [Natrinema sp. CBA1119]PGF14238.1 hypothetical protein CP556_24855 [Natrinema sp. CBA1119]
MSSEPKPIRRVEDVPGGVRVVTRNLSDLYDYRSATVLEREYPGLFVTCVPGKGGPERVRIASAERYGDGSEWQIHGANGIYAEVSIDERELSDAERAYCEEHPLYQDTESVVEFSMPHPEEIRAAIADQDLKRVHCLGAVIEDADRRHDVLTEIQERIERERVLANQLHPREGILTDVPPEWDPETDHNDGKTREHLYDMAGMRKDAHLQDFEPVAGFEYWSFWYARSRVLEFHEHDLEPWDVCGLGVVGRDGWTYCRECGAVAPDETFLHVDLERRDVTRRVCDRCADLNAGSDHCKTYTEANVDAARDDRAQREGGQRNLAGEYGCE